MARAEFTNSPRRHHLRFWIGHAASTRNVVSIGTSDVVLDDAASSEQAIAMIERHLKGAFMGGDGDWRALQGRMTPTTACW
jgi:hypothetical protein